ncbi:MAG: BON domain-containing protein [Chloroflexi bacterium]|nr:BON domain-containing protein [Chloroflexota bacterium]
MATQDERLALKVRAMLNTYTPLRVWSDRIAVETRDGTVTLAGVVRTRATSQIAEQLARGVPGVTRVVNQLVADDAVEIALAGALANDTRTQGGFPGIQVGVVFGVAYLKGLARNQTLKDAAAEIAGKVLGVQHVSDEIAVVA